MSLTSVIIPTYKGSGSVAGAVESVLRQEQYDYEVIVVDDNAPDSQERLLTSLIMGSYVERYPQVSYIKHDCNKGGSAARNTGLRAAVGDYICFLDDDDVYMPERIESSVEALEAEPSAVAVFCDVVHVYDFDGHANYYEMAKGLSPKIILRNGAAIGTGSNLFLRASTARALDGFDERFLRHQDLEFCMRLLNLGKAAVVCKPLIVKGFNGVNNVPSYDKLKETKTLFNECFSDAIDGLDSDSRSAYLRDCSMSLYRSALLSGSYAFAKGHLKEARNYGGKIGLKCLAQLLLCRFGLYSKLRGDEGKAATISNGTEAEVSFSRVIDYYRGLAEIAAKARASVVEQVEEGA